MQITDPIADLLTRIRNASTAKHPSVEIPASNMKKAICQILVDEGYIKGMQVKNDTVQGTIVVTLKYQANGEPVIAGLRRVSKPGLRIYTNCEDMPKVMKGLIIPDGRAFVKPQNKVQNDSTTKNRHFPVASSGSLRIFLKSSSVEPVKCSPPPLSSSLMAAIVSAFGISSATYSSRSPGWQSSKRQTVFSAAHEINSPFRSC